MDADGVALAAIQGLNQKLEEKLQQKGTQIMELKQAVAELTGLVSKLAGQNTRWRINLPNFLRKTFR